MLFITLLHALFKLALFDQTALTECMQGFRSSVSKEGPSPWINSRGGGGGGSNIGNDGLINAPFAESGTSDKYSVQMSGIILVNAKRCGASLRKRHSFQSAHTRT